MKIWSGGTFVRMDVRNAGIFYLSLFLSILTQSTVNSQSCSCTTRWLSNSMTNYASHSVNAYEHSATQSMNTWMPDPSVNMSYSHPMTYAANPSASYQNAWSHTSYSMSNYQSVNPAVSNSIAWQNSAGMSYWNSYSANPSMGHVAMVQSSINPSYSHSVSNWNMASYSSSWNNTSYSMWQNQHMSASNSYYMMNNSAVSQWNNNASNYSMPHVSPSTHNYYPSYTTECVCQTVSQNNAMEMMSHGSITPSMPVYMTSNSNNMMMSSHSGNMVSSQQANMMMSSHGANMMSSHSGNMMMSSHGANMVMSSHGGNMLSSQHGNMMMSSPGGNMMMSSHGANMMSSQNGNMMMSSHGGNMMMSSPGPNEVSSHQGNTMMSSPGPNMASSHQGNMIMSSPGPNMVSSHQGNMMMSSPVPNMASSHQGNMMMSSPGPNMASSHQGNMMMSSPGPNMVSSHQGNMMMSSPGPKMMSSHQGNMMMSSHGKSMAMSPNMPSSQSPMSIHSSTVKMMSHSMSVGMKPHENMSKSIHEMPSKSFSMSRMLYSSMSPKLNETKSRTPKLSMSHVSMSQSLMNKSHAVKPSQSSRHMMMSSQAVPAECSDRNISVFNMKGGFAFCHVLRILNRYGEKIAISSIHQYLEGYLTYKTPRQSQSWNNLPRDVNASHSKVVDCNDMIRFIPKDGEHGFVRIRFTIIKAKSDYADTTGNKTCSILLAVPPEKPKVMFKRDKVPINRTMVEDGGCVQHKFYMDEFLVLPSNASKIPEQWIPYINATVMEMYMNHVINFSSKFQPSIDVTKVDAANGFWSYFKNASDAKSKGKISVKSVPSITVNRALCFDPVENFAGSACADIQGVLKDNMNQMYKGETTKFCIRITGVNDRPKIKERVYRLSAVPYNNTESNRTCHKVSSFINKISEDADGKVVGIAVINSIESTFGYFEYNCNSSSNYIKIDITNNYPQKTQNISVLYLTGDDTICFVLKNDSLYWLPKTSGHKLEYLAWDGTDNETCGVRTFMRENNANPLSLSQQKGELEQLRKDCNGNPGKVATFDRCGICGGRDDCFGCDNVKSSGAQINRCGICYGGTTNKTFNSGKDCFGTCDGRAFLDQCGICVFPGGRNNTDCNGDCFGGAFKLPSTCNICVGGKTGLPLNHGKDACGVCQGDNSTCADCDGVPNGKKTNDSCGVCLEPNDPARDSTCYSLTVKSDTPVGLSTERNNVTFIVASQGYTVITAATLARVGSSAVNFVAWYRKMDGSVDAQTPNNLPPGTYKINITLNNTINLQSKNDYLIVNESAMSLDSISPNVTKVNTATDLTLCGSNFVSSPDLKCMFNWKELRIVSQNSTCIICHLPKQTHSICSNVSLSFSQKTRTYPTLKKHYCIAIDGPNVQECVYTNSLNKILLSFDKKIDFTSNGITCKDLFPYNYTSLGDSAVCQRKSAKRIEIVLNGDPTIKLGNLKISNTKLKVLGAEWTVFNESMQTCALSEPKNVIYPAVILIGPTEVGDCADIFSSIRVRRGSGGRKLQVNWTAQAVDALTSNETAELSTLNDILANYSQADRITIRTAKFVNKRIKFVVVVTNFLGYTSNESTLIVSRKASTLPNVVFGSTDITTSVNVAFQITARASIPSCSSGTPPVFFFLWSFDKTLRINFQDADLKRRKLRIGKNVLRAGETYSVTVRVITAGLSEAVTQTIQVTTTQSELVASIKAPSQIGKDSELVLDGSQSFDPDESDETAKYFWSVKEGENNVVYYSNGTLYKPPEKAKVNIDLSLLNAGTTYTFTLIYSKGARSNQATHDVKVVAGAPPVVTIVAATGPLNPSDKLVLRARIEKAQKGSYQWKSVLPDSGEGFSEISDLSSVISSKISGKYRGSSSVSLVVRPNSLLGNSLYQFQLVVGEEGQPSEVVSNINIKTNGVPSQGTLQVSQQQGTELETEFVFTVAGGCVDPDGDNVVYRFGYFTPDGKRVITDKLETDTHTTILPAGIFDYFVQCIDIYDGQSEANIQMNVSKKVIDAAALTQLTDVFTNTETSGDTTGVLVLATSVGRAVTAGDDSDSTEIPEETAKFLRTACVAIINIGSSGGAEDEDTKQSALVAINAASNGALVVLTSTQFSGLLVTILNLVKNDGSNSGNSRRKRRAVSTPEVTAKSVEQVETALSANENLLFPDQFDSQSLEAKTTFVSLFDDLSQSMCKSLAIGEDPAVAKNKFAILQAINKNFDDVDTVPVQLGCSDCPTYRNGSDYVLLGSEMQSLYDDYVCQSGQDNCSGLCISSAQLPYDLLSTSSYPSNLTRMSGLLWIKFWNPLTYVEVIPGSINSGMNVSIVVTKSTNKTYECRRWSSSSWVATGIETLTRQSYTRADGISYVDCNVTSIGYIALFEGPEIVVQPTSSIQQTMSTVMSAAQSQVLSISATSSQTMMMTSSIATTMTTTTLAPANYPRRITFRLQHSNCTLLYNETTEDAFTEEIKTKFATAVNISKDSMNNFNITCGSIVVSYEQGPTGNLTAEEAEDAVKTAVLDQSFSLTVGNETATLVPNSYASVPLVPLYATTTTKTPTVVDDDGDLSGGAIAGIVIAVFIVFIVGILLVYYLIVKKKTRKDGTVEPNDNVLELRGKHNQGYSNESP